MDGLAGWGLGMGIVSTCPNPEKAIELIEKALKDGRDNIGKGQWNDFKTNAEDLRELVEYLHVWRKTNPELRYNPLITEDIIKILDQQVSPIITYVYPEENLYGCPLSLPGRTKRKIDMSDTWELIEIAFNMLSKYIKGEKPEPEEVYDIISNMSKSDMPEELRSRT